MDVSTGPHRRRRPGIALAALATALTAAALGASAHAQLGPGTLDVGEQVQTQTGLPADTDQTPGAKDTELWEQVSGARYREDGKVELMKGSVTDFELDFYAVAFRNESNGFAGGARCKAAPEQPEAVEGCERVPVVYRHSIPPGAPGTWEEMDLGEGRDAPGYVGAIVWLGPGRAFAVGGTGRYPKRESRNDGEDYEDWVEKDPAGQGRAWLFEDGSWRELDLSAERAQGMRGMTALAFHENGDFGIAGALAQLWHIDGQNARFTEKIDRTTDQEIPNRTKRRIRYAALFEYRVRAIEFAELGDDRQAFAVTSGCCAKNSAHNTPRLLAYDGSKDRWYVRMLGDDCTDECRIPFVPSSAGRPEETSGTDGRGLFPDDQNLNHRRVNTRPGVPDSYYSLLVTPRGVGGSFTVAAVASPGGERSQDDGPELASVLFDTEAEPNSRGVKRDGSPAFINSGVSPQQKAYNSPYRLSSARLVAGDGDNVGGANANAPDARPDWMVGERRGSDRGLGGQALVVGTDRTLRPRADDALKPSCGDALAGSAEGNCRVQKLQGGESPGIDPDTLLASQQATYFKLGSYRLNAIDVVGATGAAWAVGDRGAIARLGEGAVARAAAAEPDPPKLGARSPARLPERSPFDPFRAPAADEAGTVPPLAAQPREALREPQLVPYGAADPTRPQGDLVEDARWIVMSPDGSEGWAVGPAGNGGASGGLGEGATLFRYSGSSWSRCDPLGVEGVLDPDPACDVAGPMRRYVRVAPSGARTTRPLRLLAAARVPRADGDFEVVAIGTEYKPPGEDEERCAILRYSEGSWELESAAASGALGQPRGNGCGDIAAVAFVARDDGWAIGQDGASSSLYRFDGAWRPCLTNGVATNNELCGNLDPDNPAALGRIAAGMTAKGLAVAGERVYLYGVRRSATGTGSGAVFYPVIVYREHGECGAGKPDGCWRAEGGGHDPGFGKGQTTFDPEHPERLIAGDSEQQGTVDALGVVEIGEGRFEGWASGVFGQVGAEMPGGGDAGTGSVMLHLGRSGRWEQWEKDDAARDYFSRSSSPLEFKSSTVHPHNLVVVPAPGGGTRAFAAHARLGGRILRFNTVHRRWELLRANPALGAREVSALAPDGEGGFWAAVADGIARPFQHSHFFRYTDRPHREVFEELPNPFGERRATALAGARDGTIWAATGSDFLYRYDRLAGWDRISVPGWDPGRVVTRASEARAIAVAPDGHGVAVGERGRIAQLTPEGVRLDAAAGSRCDPAAPKAPCGTGRNLNAVSVAPDGSALAGGDGRALLWRPAGGHFRAVAPPPVASSARITGVSLPRPDRAWVALDTGQVFAGRLEGGRWSWGQHSENVNADGDLLSLELPRRELALRAIAIDAAGHGYAVGDRGMILERTGDPGRPWRRLSSGVLDHLTSVALPAGGGEGALVGGEGGLVLTGAGGRFERARAGDAFRKLQGAVVGLALLPGVEDGQVEAWAVTGPGKSGSGRPGDSELLHYASDPAEPLLNPQRRAGALPDSPAPRSGELSFAALGKSDCRIFVCPALEGASFDHEVLLRHATEEIVARSRRSGGPGFAIFTGDAYERGGDSVTDTVDDQAPAATAISPAPARLKYRRFSDAVSTRLREQGVPLFGALGAQDLTELTPCDAWAAVVSAVECPSTSNQLRSGLNLPWRRGMASEPRPWGRAGEAESERYSFRAVRDSALARHLKDQSVPDPDGDGPAPGRTLRVGEARTHYALDVVDNTDAEPVARLVFVDTSLRSLAASDPQQNPLEPRGGQTAWLEEVLCVHGESASPAGGRCTRRRGQQAIVVSTTPTYSYGPGAVTDTQTDATAFEALLMKHRANLVVSGRLGWNGRYWATAPGVHEPCAGGDYQEQAPEPGRRVCGRSEPELPVDPAGSPAGERLSQSLQGLGAPPPPDPSSPPDPTGALNESGLLPFVVASSAGGKLGGEGEAGKGFWRGYTIVRLDPSGDPRQTIVEQRPAFDWIAIEAQEHVLRPGQKLTLRGIGREAAGRRTVGPGSRVRFDRIDSPAVTHRYDLVEADGRNPSVPKRGADGAYVPLAPDVAAVDSQSGVVRTGRGNHPRAYAVAILSVGGHVATWPLVFEPRRSFRAKPPAALPALPLPKVAATAFAAVQAPQAPPPVNPPTPQVNLPAPPTIPGLPTPSASPPAPPAPPAPPPPPVSPQATPLDLVTTPLGLNIAPQATVIPPPAPPIQPAPPGGARREARQRQAATQKSGADVGQGSDATGDLATSPDNPTAADMTRRNPTRPEPGSLTALTNHTQPSAWSRNLAYGGGLGLAALALALGFATARPTPRRRRPQDRAAPAWVPVRRR